MSDTDSAYSAMLRKPRHARNAPVGTINASLPKRQIGECLRSSEHAKLGTVKRADRRYRQVQDLQSQIAELTQMNTQLRTKTVTREDPIVERPEPRRRLSGSYSGPPAVRHEVFYAKKLTAPVMRDFDHVRRNIQTHSRGIFDTPHMRGSVSLEAGSGLPDVPARADFAHLSRSYLNHIHYWYPALHWPTFSQQVDEVYTARSFSGMSREWIGLFFAVLACGSLGESESSGSPRAGTNRGMAFFDIASQALTPWPQDLTVAHAQVALLLSIYATESNMKSIGSMWLSNAVRIAQELCINTEIDSWPVVEGEVRRRLWWAIYSRDRYELCTQMTFKSMATNT